MGADSAFADLLTDPGDDAQRRIVGDLERVHTAYLPLERDAATEAALGLGRTPAAGHVTERARQRYVDWKVLALPLASIIAGLIFTASTLSAAWNAAQTAPPSALDTLRSVIDPLPPDKKAAVLLHIDLNAVLQSASAHTISVSYVPVVCLAWLSLVIVNGVWAWVVHARMG